MIRCQACGRRMLKPAYTAPASLGAWALGPVCVLKKDLPDSIMRVLLEDRTARVMRMGLTYVPLTRKRTVVIPVARQVMVLPGQLHLFPPVPA